MSKLHDFKPGQWIRPKDDKGRDRKPFKLAKIKSHPEIVYTEKDILVDIDGNKHYSTNCELWYPKSHEMCWFWNTDDPKYDTSPHIGKYGYMSYTHDYYDVVEPFVYDLPSFMKEGNVDEA